MYRLHITLLLIALHLPAQAVTAIVLDMPGFAWNGHGWIPELLGRMQLQQQTIDLRILPPARAVERYYRDGQGDLFAADLLCRRQDSHFLTLGVRDYEVFITRQGDKVPTPGSLPPAGKRMPRRLLFQFPCAQRRCHAGARQSQPFQLRHQQSRWRSLACAKLSPER